MQVEADNEINEQSIKDVYSIREAEDEQLEQQAAEEALGQLKLQRERELEERREMEERYDRERQLKEYQDH